MSLTDSFTNGVILAFKPIIFMLVPLLITAGLIWMWKRWFVNRNRRSPLNFELLRTPGYGLSKKLEDFNFDIISNLMFITFLPVLVYSLYLSQIIDKPSASKDLLIWIYCIAGFIGYAYFLYKLIKLLITRQKYRQALDGELATAQCLEPVIAGGGRIFHDFQADGFNIDHVVVSIAGVFAVETKHRLKPTNVNAKEMAKVRFDGKVLNFPGWVETLPVDQSRRQAVWLSKYLSKSTGEEIQVKPVLALPGWYVTNTGRSDVIVVNPKMNTFMFKSQDGQTIAEDCKQRICFQLEQRCQEPAEAKKLKQSN
ncbi:MAG: nuclease-related domain-containing protein [Proteobacteria bacterium]|nr:nuclease-related domain-containing protein [Pseudomonadota bacterium]